MFWVQQLQRLPDLKGLMLIAILLSICLILRVRALGMLVLGVFWASSYGHLMLSGRLPEELEGQIVRVEGEITGLPKIDTKRARFDFKVKQDREGIPDKIRLNWYFPSVSVKAGQQWILFVKLKRPHGSFNPGGFDYEQWLLAEGIGATGYVRLTPAPLLTGTSSMGLSLARWRQAVAGHLERLAGRYENIGIISALTLGDKQHLTRRHWDIFRNTGTVHLMAISGLHIGLVAGLIYWWVLKFWGWTGILQFSPQKIAAVFSLLAALFYSAMAGFSVPTQRALVMVGVAMVALLLQRNTRPLHALALALWAVLLLDPLAILSPGFWLSFLAVGFMFYVLSGRLNPGRVWLVSLKIQWVLAIALAPALLFFFQQFSLVAPIANAFAVPIVSLLVVPLSLLSVVFEFSVPQLAEPVFFLINFILRGLMFGLDYLSALSWSVFKTFQPSMWSLLFAGLGVLLALAPRGVPGKRLGWVMFLPLFFGQQERLQPGEFSMTLLDVGQGLSAVIHTASHTLVFDTGAQFDTGNDMGSMVVLPYLRHRGVEKLDALVISHGDNDHIGGADSLFKEATVNAVFSSVPALIHSNLARQCTAGQTWRWDQVSFKMLGPSAHGFMSENDNSCVLKIVSRHGSVLLTGDIEQKAEKWLIERYHQQLKSTVLVVPHHGSQTSSSLDFLRQIQPEIALIPAGYKNRFGFPHQKVMTRLNQQSRRVMNVAQEGAILIDLKAKGVYAHSYRKREGKYWNSVR